MPVKRFGIRFSMSLVEFIQSIYNFAHFIHIARQRAAISLSKDNSRKLFHCVRKITIIEDDILMGRFIMCVGVLPKSVLDGKREKKRNDEPPYEEGVRARVENVLSQFKRRYPSFKHNFVYELAATSYQETPMRDWLYALAKDSAEKKSMENLLNPRSVGDRFSEIQGGLAFVIDKMDQLEEAGRYDLLATDDDDSDEGIDPETGLPYLEETEELSEEDMEIADYVWSHPDEIDEAIEQARKAEASKKKKSAATQEDEAD